MHIQQITDLQLFFPANISLCNIPTSGNLSCYCDEEMHRKYAQSKSNQITFLLNFYRFIQVLHYWGIFEIMKLFTSKSHYDTSEELQTHYASYSITKGASADILF